MYCENCGNNVGDMNVCSRCGHVVDMGGAAPPWREDEPGQARGGAMQYMGASRGSAGPGQTRESSMQQRASPWSGADPGHAGESGAQYETPSWGTENPGRPDEFTDSQLYLF